MKGKGHFRPAWRETLFEARTKLGVKDVVVEDKVLLHHYRGDIFETLAPYIWALSAEPPRAVLGF